MTPSFDDYCALLRDLLERRQSIVDNIERRLLNVRGKPLTRSRARDTFAALFNGCFVLSAEAMRLQRMLAAAQVNEGFEPLNREDYSQQLDPIDLILRAYEYWDAHRWPGVNGRLAFAQTLYSAFLVRQLEHLSLRIWDGGIEDAIHRLNGVQRLLDANNGGAAAPPFVRDAGWLIQSAQGPLTRELAPYFRVAERIASLPPAVALRIHAAGAKLAGGHLRSQLRYRAAEMRLPPGDPRVLATARNSNSMDVALLVRDLVPLLEAYKACGANEERTELADAVMQGLAADPDLLVVRLDLLTPMTMIEELFVGAGASGACYTASGEAHVALLVRYHHLLAELAPSLRADALTFAPSALPYSPLGIVYGFCADLFSNAAMDALADRSGVGVAIEDMFTACGRLEDKRAQAERWARLPRRAGEHDHFEHSPEWAADVYERLRVALDARAVNPRRENASAVRDARLVVNPGSAPDGAVDAQEHCVTSDLAFALDTGATAFPKSQILSDRKEARYLASAESAGKWFAVSKVLLTLRTAQGDESCITDIPAAVLDVLRLTCRGLLD